MKDLKEIKEMTDDEFENFVEKERDRRFNSNNEHYTISLTIQKEDSKELIKEIDLVLHSIGIVKPITYKIEKNKMKEFN